MTARVSFYAPLKPPTDPRPSGDRRMARLLIEALGIAGFEVSLASRFRSLGPADDPVRLARLETVGRALADRLIRRYRAAPAATRPDIWFTYHLYYKAPDWIGPRVAAALDIPYVAAEASHAAKQADGPFATGYAAALAAIRQAALIVNVNSADRAGLLQAGVPPARILDLKPFVPADDLEGLPNRNEARATIAESCGADPGTRWMLAVGMMRRGAKAESYRLLADALPRLAARDWSLLVAGDGPLEHEVREMLEVAAPGRVAFAGLLDRAQMKVLHAAADLFVWPSIGEAYGMALLEALGAGLPVVAGATGGVPDLITDGENGRLVPVHDASAFAAAIDELLGDPAGLQRMGKTAAQTVRAQHLMQDAAEALRRSLVPLSGGRHAA